MANQEHLDILKQGVRAWNQRRAEHPDIRPDLWGAHLRDVNLYRAHLRDANLNRANLSDARIWSTIFGDIDLSSAKGLETVIHWGPSTIGINTIYRSQGKIPEVFLKRTGVPDSFLDYMRSLVSNPIDYYSCF